MAGADILEILSPGIHTTVQDLGRYGYGRYGVAPSGALDTFALRIANLLVGNTEDQAGLEAMWRSHAFKKNDILSFGSTLSGFRAYIAVAGGIRVPSIMGSRSTNLSSGFGGLRGRVLGKSDILACENDSSLPKLADRSLNVDLIPSYPTHWLLRVIWGAQDDHFPEESRNAFLNETYKVSPDSDRTGIRLEGAAIRQKSEIPESIISEGVIAGSVQIPGDGKPIIILGETVTGGYRKIATVISADLPLLGQMKPGDTVRFSAISLDEARGTLVVLEEKIRAFKNGME
jgi:antagonist of KipI